ncbi:hypothetical protein HanIR_Chr11g0559711 [Helianthus annuus]|nr:hypothetical protein HanIR_Chr11g0559711 [Helianthus annuus]
MASIRMDGHPDGWSFGRMAILKDGHSNGWPFKRMVTRPVCGCLRTVKGFEVSLKMCTKSNNDYLQG